MPWCDINMTSVKQQRAVLICALSSILLHYPKLLRMFFPRSPIESAFAVTRGSRVIAEISVIKVGSKLRLVPSQSHFLEPCYDDFILLLGWMSAAEYSLGSCLLTGRYCAPQHCDLTCSKPVPHPL